MSSYLALGDQVVNICVHAYDGFVGLQLDSHPKGGLVLGERKNIIYIDDEGAVLSAELPGPHALVHGIRLPDCTHP